MPDLNPLHAMQRYGLAPTDLAFRNSAPAIRNTLADSIQAVDTASSS